MAGCASFLYCSFAGEASPFLTGVDEVLVVGTMMLIKRMAGNFSSRICKFLDIKSSQEFKDSEQGQSITETPHFRYQEVEDDMVQMLQLAVDCVVQHPDKRPSMSEVTSRIEDLCHFSGEVTVPTPNIDVPLVSQLVTSAILTNDLKVILDTCGSCR